MIIISLCVCIVASAVLVALAGTHVIALYAGTGKHVVVVVIIIITLGSRYPYKGGPRYPYRSRYPYKGGPQLRYCTYSSTDIETDLVSVQEGVSVSILYR